MNCFLVTVCTYVLKKIVMMSRISFVSTKNLLSRQNSIILKKVTFWGLSVSVDLLQKSDSDTS
jgi:hypothetical protein